MSVTASEAWTNDFARRAFLNRYVYPNPRMDNGKEFCDLLVVAANTVLVFEVKDCNHPESSDPTIDLKRWVSRTVKKAARQLNRAASRLTRGVQVFDEHGAAIRLPTPAEMEVHLIAVALGARPDAGMFYGTGKIEPKGHEIHVLDEVSLPIVLTELDTLTDFRDYLRAKTALPSELRLTVFGGEHNLMAWYLLQGRTFDTAADSVMIMDDLWDGYQSRAEVVEKMKQDEVSYNWDKIILRINRYMQYFSKEHQADAIERGSRALDNMSLENRSTRRHLGSSVAKFLEAAYRRASVARAIELDSALCTYVLQARWPHQDAALQGAQLESRCILVKCEVSPTRPVVGLGFCLTAKGPETESVLIIDDIREVPLPLIQMAREANWFSANRSTTTEHYEYSIEGDKNVAEPEE